MTTAAEGLERVGGLREELRALAAQQPKTEGRDTYSDGFAQGLFYAIEQLDRLQSLRSKPMGGAEVWDEVAVDQARGKAVAMLKEKGWKPGDSLHFPAVLSFMVEFAQRASEITDRCGYPDCGCDHDARCLTAAKAVETKPEAWVTELSGLQVATIQHDDYSLIEVSKIRATDFHLTIHRGSDESARWDDLSIDLTAGEAAKLASALTSPPLLDAPRVTDEMVERAARAMFGAAARLSAPEHGGSIKGPSYKDLARAALSALQSGNTQPSQPAEDTYRADWELEKWKEQAKHWEKAYLDSLRISFEMAAAKEKP